jgi:hypothetical protein
MKLNARYALFLCLLLPVACHKKDAPAAAGSAAASGAISTDSAPGSLAVLDGCEGEIGVSAKGKFNARDGAVTPVSFTLAVKDGKFRVDLPDSVAEAQGVGKAFVLVTPADKKLYAVLDAKKQVIMIDFDKFANQAKMLSQAHGHAEPKAGAPADVQKTGKTDTVAGYKCEIWHIVQAKSVGDLCIAEQGTSWFHIPLAGLPAEFAWATEITDGKHFPLRLVMSENGVEQARIEVTSIQKKSLPATEFTVPVGYNVMDLDQMLGAMLGGMGGMVPPGGMPAGALPPGFPPGMLPHGRPGAQGPKP